MEQQLAEPAAPGTILIVDDNSEARRLLEARVRREGHQVVLAENGQQALEALGREPIDMILLDLYMPVKGGFEVLSAVKADPDRGHIPIVIISAGDHEEDLIRCIEMGAVDYLAKPFNQAVLRARLATGIAAKRQRDRELESLRKSSRGIPSIADAPAPRQAAGGHPKAFGRIVVQGVIGTGSMGIVYRGHHELLDMPMAVKVLRPDVMNTPEMRERIRREACVAARINHPNVVRLHEIGETEEGLYLAYEYVDGGTLADLMARRPGRRLEISSVVRVVRKVALGLTAIHGASVTHRDIKPANLLITQDGKIKIADLGLAKRTGGVSTAPSLTGENIVLGTPAYMAPEQAQGARDLDIRCDLYALGCVLYEMLTGATPFERKSAMAILLSHLTARVPSLSEKRPDVPPRLEEICMKLLAKERGQRYQTPDELLADLQELKV